MPTENAHLHFLWAFSDCYFTDSAHGLSYGGARLGRTASARHSSRTAVQKSFPLSSVRVSLLLSRCCVELSQPEMRRAAKQIGLYRLILAPSAVRKQKQCITGLLDTVHHRSASGPLMRLYASRGVGLLKLSPAQNSPQKRR